MKQFQNVDSKVVASVRNDIKKPSNDDVVTAEKPALQLNEPKKRSRTGKGERSKNKVIKNSEAEVKKF